MNKSFRKIFQQMIKFKYMKPLPHFYLLCHFLASQLQAEYEMHIPNCTQKGVENCGGFYLIMKLVMFYFVDQKACKILSFPNLGKLNKKISNQSKIKLLKCSQISSRFSKHRAKCCCYST